MEEKLYSLWKWYHRVNLLHRIILICWSFLAWYYGTILYPLIGNMSLKYLEKFHFNDGGKLKGFIHFIPSILFSLILLMLLVTGFSIVIKIMVQIKKSDSNNIIAVELFKFQSNVGKIGFIGVLFFLIILFFQDKNVPQSALGKGLWCVIILFIVKVILRYILKLISYKIETIQPKLLGGWNGYLPKKVKLE
ncbi:hypothetical protein K3S47_002597 [Listeria monocytogenes]|nr:hypothetical protein [Listeria monocytogenes]EAH0912695.1 hypothetical protein [Listeria monocytogenes]EAH2863710.1 hypothetical protein [Listeria monocytogenes]EHV9323372.1 hypothetical protein [Listeria monocytogenes]EHW9366417.1 hypothetical protein [Listeria monocytogenes]